MRKSLRQHQNARAIVNALTGSWRSDAAPPPITAAELAETTPLLIQSGAGALVWWRIRHDKLAKSGAGAQLHQMYRLHRLEASLHVDRLKRVVRQFRKAGIVPVLVKGWNVARLYPEPGLRHYFDVDLCVPHDGYAEANRLVTSLGREGLYVDLHDELDHLDVMTWDEVFSCSQLLRLDETEVRVPCAEDHLRILSIHWLRHGAWRPAGLCDIAAALESRPDDFDWQRCLGADPVRADWVACAIGLAQELLGAEIGDQRSKFNGRSADIPVALSARRESLPRWLIPAVLRQWDRGVSPNHRVPAGSALLGGVGSWKELARNFFMRLDQPVRATIALHGRFNNWPRLPYQLGELLLHRADKCQNSWARWFPSSQRREGWMFRSTVSP
jgi:Uncharacterised nucleotidyltransferase